MSLKENWKETGKGLGQAFAGLGKTLVRSAETTADKVTDWAEGKKPEEKAGETTENAASSEEKATVYSDGSWRKTGKELGHAFAGLGKTLVKTAETGAEKVSDWAEGEKPEEGKKE